MPERANASERLRASSSISQINLATAPQFLRYVRLTESEKAWSPQL